jgi:iron-sulfur cluster assembly protein
MEQSTNVVTITDKALEQIQSIYEKEGHSYDRGLRLGVIGGGCSGLSYKIDFDEVKEKDHVIKHGQIRILIDLKSAIYLRGVVLDFEDGLKGKGFVFKNPNATNTCGCGESFSV